MPKHRNSNWVDIGEAILHKPLFLPKIGGWGDDVKALVVLLRNAHLGLVLWMWGEVPKA